MLDIITPILALAPYLIMLAALAAIPAETVTREETDQSSDAAA